MITFSVDSVEKATSPERMTNPKRAIEYRLKTPVESCSEYTGEVVSCSYHPFVNAVHDAYSRHYPLILSPDMFWLLFTQGLAYHINLNSEKMRHYFTDKKAGKEQIKVRRDNFVKGALENPWEEVFADFSQQIKSKIGAENHGNIVTNFSTTGKIEQAANEVVLMDAMQSYFEFLCTTWCGIPEITLEGELSDWQLLRSRILAVGETYDLQWWTDHLSPILDRIVNTAKEVNESTLWSNFYKISKMSGGPFISGWIIQWFPYIQKSNGSIEQNAKFDSLTHPRFPSGLSSAPFKWQYLSEEYDMEFIAGFTSYTQDKKTLALRPKIGWAVREKPALSNAEIFRHYNEEMLNFLRKC
ncbi:DUF4419 domain-containing protein [Planktothricoides raciborskii]|uniref:DUF4419 domain-containing protein n=1 Tax=Planktothricoides raciborskii GIHE-MW2 TaxID=2792601 RepID=A0AAU8JLQ0_9CYAN